MFVEINYDKRFTDFWGRLQRKYPYELFNLEGVGDQLDLNLFSRKFFTSTVMADSSIDANANVDDVSVIAYNTELPKPYFKLNSYFVLWDMLRKLYLEEVANEIVERQSVGDIYIHDFMVSLLASLIALIILLMM